MLKELRGACAVNAAVLGATFVSGREAAVFFAGAGWASWFAVAAAGIVFGVFMGMICRFAVDTGARDMPEIFRRKMDERCGDAVGMVHALLMLMMGAAALTTAGELGMLSLGGDRPYLIGAGLAVAAAALAAISGIRPLRVMGLVIVPVCAVFFISLALDRRPAAAEAYLQAEYMGIEGNVPAAVIMGAMYASLKAAMACGAAALNSRGVVPWKFGTACGVIMGIIACGANWALQAAGQGVWALNLPMVVLAARWGSAGYYICILVMWLGTAAVLACAITSVMALFSRRISRPAALILTIAGVIMMSVTGLKSLVGVGFPMLGWICAMCLCMLAFFYERRGRSSISGVKSVG